MLRPRGCSIRDRQSAIRQGFSLVELLVVIGLAVLIMALALPAFNFITGSRSVDGATNIVSAFIGRARAEALESGRISGVMFYIDPATERRGMILVADTNPKYGPPPLSDPLDNRNIDVYLDLLPDREPILLPLGIDAVFIASSQPGFPDRYQGYVSVGWPTDGSAQIQTQLRYGGVILFDGRGTLISVRYAFRAIRPGSPLAQVPAGSAETTAMGKFMLPQPPAVATARDFARAAVPSSPQGAAATRSALGLALVEADLFRNLDASVDPQQWLDANATPLLINRYNGTLVRGQ